MKEFLKEPVWLQSSLILFVQGMLIREHGGLAGIRDEGALSSALSRPLHLYAYGEPDLYDLAAAYAYGLTKNHPFLDGNKRIAFMAAYIFLECNEQPLILSEQEAVILMQRLAAGEIKENDFARSLKNSSFSKSLQ